MMRFRCIGALGMLSCIFALLSNAPIYAASKNETTIVPALFNDGAFFRAADAQARPTAQHTFTSGITVPHHLLARDLIADTFAYISRQSPDRVIILSPDHFFRATRPISIADQDFDTPFGVLRTDHALVERLRKEPFVGTTPAVYREHGVHAVLPFIKLHFPHVRILVVLFRSDASQQELDRFSDPLKMLLTPRTLIVQSTDFSHYLPARVADKRDQETKRVILLGDERKLFSLRQPDHLDSIAAQYVQMKLQKEYFNARAIILATRNSQYYTQKDLAETTSYITQIFSQKPPKASLTFVGDIMLGRTVETLMKKFGPDYPFTSIAPLFEKSSAVIGNLEGPIIAKHSQTPIHSLRFSFASSTAAALARAHITHVTLGNNHTNDHGAQGLLETRRFLAKESIRAFGDFANTPSTLAWKGTIDGRTAILYSLNATMHTDIPHTLSTRIAQENCAQAHIFCAVLIHWGVEYQPIATHSQRAWAHMLIDAGADVIIGHHPHVVQNIERFKGKLIFYSLGNFVFDQYFSKETQKGLALSITFGNSDRITLLPISIIRSKPTHMDMRDVKDLLEEIAQKSDVALAAEIRAGMLTLNAFVPDAAETPFLLKDSVVPDRQSGSILR